ncbi:hypothetical protein K470DRAFT_257542 [Piedraia hortae CBS 480.64]|uniref:Acyl-coenzyme A diphosphatase SCS3 n=1 Tax=Piedraia hortae CBS 480.64 TaxID=1314780 RepID=A0A6A7BZK6_9PEZI|nr:hypothetical protein K470DRAFT_257542 [Piedraia hortae CBS 480.64]
MATRRTKVEVPIDRLSNSERSSSMGQSATIQGASLLNYPPPFNSPWLPTPLEAALLSIYPLTLLLGSIFSMIHPSTRSATYLHVSQSYDPSAPPSYFAKKSNIFNVYFVKVGWFWTTLAFVLLLALNSRMGPSLSPVITRRRRQALLRYTCITLVWTFVTQWCFGPPIVDRSFRWTGGRCFDALEEGDDAGGVKGLVKEGKFETAFTHAACKALGGQWRGGHDISGHVFMLILGSAMLWMELLPLVLKADGLREARRVRKQGLVRSATTDLHSDRNTADGDKGRDASQDRAGLKPPLIVAGLSWWMLLMTAAYFHTWFEKVTGLLVAFVALYAVYFLPRGVGAWRDVVGLPGI